MVLIIISEKAEIHPQTSSTFFPELYITITAAESLTKGLLSSLVRDPTCFSSVEHLYI